MTEAQIQRLARQCLKAGPAVIHDAKGNGYLGYVSFVREGTKFSLMTVDSDIAELNGSIIEFLVSEIRSVVKHLGSIPLSAERT